MANKSTKSPSGEDREQPSPHIREQKVEEQDLASNTGTPPTNPSPAGKQENLKNRGYEEDHPKNPVRTTGSTREDQETMPTGEPDPGEI